MDEPRRAAAEWRANWPMVAAATSAMSFASLSTASFGVMLLPIERELGWSRTEIATGPLLISLVTISLGTLIGAAVDRFGPRIVGSAALALLCGALAMLTQIGAHLWTWWAVWAAIGLASAAIPPSTVTPVSRSFFAGRGFAMAIVLSGSGISSFLVPSLANGLVEAHGWRMAYLYLAVIWGAVALPLVMLFLRPPPPVQAVASEAIQDELPGLGLREAFRKPVFYKLLAATFASTAAGTALVLNLVPVLHSTGLTTASAAAIAGSIGIATIAGRVIGGGLIDRFSAGRIAASVSAVSIALPATLLLLPGFALASVAGVFIYGMMGGALTPAIAYLASRHLGQRSFGTLYATINAVLSLGVGLGPLLANFIYDRTQTYEPVLWATIPMFALGALLYASLGPYPDFTAPGKPAE